MVLKQRCKVYKINLLDIEYSDLLNKRRTTFFTEREKKTLELQY